MKKIIALIVFLIVSGCSSTRFVDSWKNPDVTSFKPNKLLVIGMSDNLTARKIFEEDLKNAFLKRNINAVESTTVFELEFTASKKTEEEIDEKIQELSSKGFDAVIITSVKGVEERRSYSPGYYTIGYRWTRFGRYYYHFQDVYYTPNQYEDYKVYHVESSIYHLNIDNDKSLVWVGSLNLVNPQRISTSVKDYVTRIIAQLEEEGLITKL